MNSAEQPSRPDFFSRTKLFWKKQKVLILFVIVMAIILAVIVPPVSRSNSYYFKNYPVNVTIEVEEPLSVDAARALTLLSLESMNKTFGYEMNLVSAVSFPDDSVEEYSRESIISGFKKSFLRLSAQWEQQVKMTIRFYKGLGPGSEDGKIRALGSSNWGSSISLYFSDSYEIIQFDDEEYLLSPQMGNRPIITIIHEFGHAFGLEHNLDSPIMYTIDPEVNPDGLPQPPLNINGGDVTIPPLWNSTHDPDEVIKVLEDLKVTGPLRLYQEKSDTNHLYIYKDQEFDKITLLYLSVTSGDQGNATSWQIDASMKYFLLSDYSKGWLDSEIDKCT